MPKSEKFEAIYQRACKRKGSEKTLESRLSRPRSSAEIAAIADDRFLAEFTKKVFQSGFVWRVVSNKWPDFEEVFWGFDIDKMILIPDELLENKAQDPRIIRNYSKVKTIRDNALMIEHVRAEHGSFGQFVAAWPGDNIIGLWAYMKKHGARLGGNTGAYALRALGKDTFIISHDVESYFRQRDIISGGLQSQSSLKAIQLYFNELQQQSGRSLQEISLIIANSVGDNLL